MQRRNHTRKDEIKGLNEESPSSRVNYEAHSNKFMDWADELGLESTLFGRAIAFLEDRFGVRRFGFVFLFTVVLAYTLGFELRADLNYELGEIVPYDLVSPISFEMVDEVTTEEKRLRAEGAVPYIFDFDPGVFERTSSQIYRAFRVMRTKIKFFNWPKQAASREEKVKEFFIHKGEFEKDLGVAVPDYLFEWLVQNRFNARIENIVIRNLEQWYNEKIVENRDKVVPSRTTMVLARTVTKSNTGKEISLRKSDLLDNTDVDQFQLKDTAGLEKAGARAVNYTEAFARLLIYPNLTLNKQEIATRKQAAREAVLPITISIKRNQVIVDRGVTIQPFHMAIFKEIQSVRAAKKQDVVSFTMAMVLLSLIVVFFQYLRRFSLGKVKVEDKDILVMGVVTLFIVVVSKFFLFTTETAFGARFGAMVPAALFLYAAPVAAGPMLVGLLIHSGEVVWLFTAFLAITMGLMTDFNMAFMIVTLAGGIAAARGVYSCKKETTFTGPV